MATHSSVLAWRIPGTGEPGGLPPMGSHRVGHDWSDSAAAAASSDLLGFGWSRLSSVIGSSVSSLSLPLSLDAWVWSSHVLLMAKTSGTVQSSLGPWVGGHALSLLRTLQQNVGQTLVYEWRTHSAPSSRDSRATWQRTGWKMLIILPITRLRMAVHHGALLVWETLLSLGAEPPSMSLLHLEMMPGSWLFPWQGFGWRVGEVGQVVHHLSCSEPWGSLVSNLVFESAFPALESDASLSVSTQISTRPFQGSAIHNL